MIIRTIIQSLLKYDEIGINNLGTFRKESRSSEIIDGKILPPKVILKFTYDNDVSGFAFVMALSTNEQIRLVEADNCVNEWVENLIKAIENNKSISFENFGTFYKDSNDHIVFESAIIKELNLEYEGMKPVSLQPLTDKPVTPSDNVPDKEPEEETPMIPEENPEEASSTKTEETAEAEITPEPVPEESFSPLETEEEMPVETEEETPVETEPKNDTDDETEIDTETNDNQKIKKRKLKWEILIFILIILGVLVLLAFLFKDELKPYYEKIFPKKSNTEVTTPTVEEPKEEQQIPVIDTISVQEDTLVSETEAGTQHAVQSSAPNVSKSNEISTIGDGKYISFTKGKYYVIAGSFVNESDAMKHIQEKNLTQYDAKLLKQSGNNRIRVCIGIFDTEKSAMTFAKNINDSFWVLK